MCGTPAPIPKADIAVKPSESSARSESAQKTWSNPWARKDAPSEAVNPPSSGKPQSSETRSQWKSPWTQGDPAKMSRQQTAPVQRSDTQTSESSYHRSKTDNVRPSCASVQPVESPQSNEPSQRPPAQAGMEWTCSLCTFENKPEDRKCEMCSSPNPNAPGNDQLLLQQMVTPTSHYSQMSADERLSGLSGASGFRYSHNSERSQDPTREVQSERGVRPRRRGRKKKKKKKKKRSKDRDSGNAEQPAVERSGTSTSLPVLSKPARPGRSVRNRMAMTFPPANPNAESDSDCDSEEFLRRQFGGIQLPLANQQRNGPAVGAPRRSANREALGRTVEFDHNQAFYRSDMQHPTDPYRADRVAQAAQAPQQRQAPRGSYQSAARGKRWGR